MEFEPAYNRYAIASLNQRLGALIVDFLSCWFLAELLQAILTITTSATLQFFAFLVMWVIFGYLWRRSLRGKPLDAG
ncbi:MAG: hypothetical protein ACK456_16400 [Pseudanabaenaceae cyanobacterium]